MLAPRASQTVGITAEGSAARADLGMVTRGASNIGAAVFETADRVTAREEAVRERARERDRASYVTSATAQAQKEWRERFLALSSSETGEADGFTARVGQEYDAWAEQSLAKIDDPDTQALMRDRIARLGEDLHGQAFQFEARQRVAVRGVRFDEALGNLARAVQTDPAAWQSLLDQGLGDVAGAEANWMTPEAAARYRAALPAMLSASAIDGMIREAPRAALQALRQGRETDPMIAAMDPNGYSQAVARAEAVVKRLDAEAKAADMSGARRASDLTIAVGRGQATAEDIEQAAAAGDISWGDRARLILALEGKAQNQAEAEAEAARAAAQSDLEIAVFTGDVGAEGVERAFELGLLSAPKRTELMKAALKTAEDQAQTAAMVGRVETALSDPEQILDAKSADDRKAVDAYWAKVAPSLAGMEPARRMAETADLVARVGVVPGPVKSEIRTGLAGAPPEKAGEIVDLLDRIETLPGGWDAVDGDLAPMARLAVDRYRAGMPAAQAAESARADTDPTKRAVIEARAAALKDGKYAGQYGKWVVEAFDPLGVFNTPDLAGEDLAQAAGDFGVLFEQAYRRTGDANAAKTLALQDFKRAWGVTAVDGDARITRYPPEAWFGVGAAEGDAAWMGRQLRDDLAGLGVGADAGALLMADALTARQAGTQAGPSWLVLAADEYGVLSPLLDSDGRAVRWRPDAARANAELVAAARQRRKEEAAKARLLNRPFPASPAYQDQRSEELRAIGGGENAVGP